MYVGETPERSGGAAASFLEGLNRFGEVASLSPQQGAALQPDGASIDSCISVGFDVFQSQHIAI